MNAVITDMDGCYSIEQQNSLEGYFQRLVNAFTSDSLSSGSKILKELAGLEPSYRENEEIVEYLENADRTYLVTGRPYWGRIRDNTEEILEDFEHEFDEIIMYPGKTIDGEDVLDTDHSIYSLLTGNGIPEYKRQIIEDLASEHAVTYIDDSEDCHTAVASVDGVTHLDDRLEEIQV